MVKNPPANAGGKGSIPGLGRSSGDGNGNPLQYSCLENMMDRGACQATSVGYQKESGTTQRLNNNKKISTGKPLRNSPHYLLRFKYTHQLLSIISILLEAVLSLDIY